MIKNACLNIIFLINIVCISGFVSLKASAIEHHEDISNSEIELGLSLHPDNSLMVNASIATVSKARVAIRVKSANTKRRRTGYSNLGTEHHITVAGLRADTTYRFTAVAIFETGKVVSSEEVTFKTGSLPVGAPAINVLASTERSEGGITIFAPASDENSRYWGIDEEGEVVWYLHGDLPLAGAPVARNLGDGKLLLLLDQEARIVTLTGETLKTFPLPSYHHDAVLLDSGNLLALTYARETVDGVLLQGDVIVEVDSQGNTVWEWSAFDHLDTNRFPGALASRVLGNGATDWTHSNALFHIAEDDSILLSSRSQSWVINIDHQSGDVRWIMGSNTEVSGDLANKFFDLNHGSWMASQHAVTITNSGEVLIYDNRNEAELSGNIYNSRAVKFALDTSTMAAEQSWEYIAPKYTQSLGDVDELAGGNILVCAGGPSDVSTGGDRNAHLVEVTADEGAPITWEVEIENTLIYRAERITWGELLGRTDSEP
ncbi:aryl-sulfate sulfotransferase [Microbulbifer epialgicus]|uniref:Aryl-sulfate sulfotransferase n=1 Tax=Microbulbifer epialgicus TaxID=393907 RepID=A0ABV4P491_9GAMM